MPKITFILPNEEKVELEVEEATTILEAAHSNKIPLEGACEGSLACSTCHVIVEPEFFEKLEEASEDEEDMLDMAFGLTATSRLGCQIAITSKLDGIVVRVPSASRNN